MISQRFSTTVRSILQPKHLLPTFWFDLWTKLRPLNLVFGSSGSTQLRLVVSVSVADAVRDGHWNLPPERSENAETLQVVFSTTSAPLTTNDNDSYLWRSQ